jgi:N-methylhydantoinase A
VIGFLVERRNAGFFIACLQPLSYLSEITCAAWDECSLMGKVRGMRIGIDIGGTFTDFVLFDEVSSSIRTYKVPSTPLKPTDAVLAGLETLRPGPHSYIIHGSTVATNALLERKGARTALLTTRGFRDVLAIGRQTRPELYDLFTDRPEPIIPSDRRLEVDERMDHLGNILVPLKEGEIPALVAQLKELEVESVAICLLFSFVNPKHEQQLAQVLREEGFHVSASIEILPEFREYERSSTTAINAYVAPAMERYLGSLGEGLQTQDFYIMQSNGGMIRAELVRAEPIRAILSGPAGGVVGSQYVAKLAGFDQMISFDMGGTSTDVSLCEGEIQVTYEGGIGGFPIRIPMVDIHTMGSGGGSIARVDAGGILRVGPDSAGAEPGPVCYGRGGMDPTVTDANLVLGRLAADTFLGGRLVLEEGAAKAALERLAEEVQLQPGGGLSAAQVAALGVIRVTNAHMERAIRVISVERGYDPKDFILVSFGGAGGLHAVDLARAVGIPKVLVPRGASTLSAFGMLVADVLKDYVQTVMLPEGTSYEELASRTEPMVERGVTELREQGVQLDDIVLHREVDMRYVGQGYELSLPLSRDFIHDFHALHMRRYGHNAPDAPVEVVNVRLRAVGHVPKPSLPQDQVGESDPTAALVGRRSVVLGEQEVSLVPFYSGEDLKPGNVLKGPAIVAFEDTTIFLAEGDLGEVDGYFNLVVEVGSRKLEVESGK